jgi:hypothetical protein
MLVLSFIFLQLNHFLLKWRTSIWIKLRILYYMLYFIKNVSAIDAVILIMNYKSNFNFSLTIKIFKLNTIVCSLFLFNNELVSTRRAALLGIEFTTKKSSISLNKNQKVKHRARHHINSYVVRFIHKFQADILKQLLFFSLIKIKHTWI